MFTKLQKKLDDCYFRPPGQDESNTIRVESNILVDQRYKILLNEKKRVPQSIYSF